MNTIITIGRQYGSAGREIGLRLARDYGIKCYDKELLDRAAKDSGMCKELFEADEQFSVFSGHGYILLWICFQLHGGYADQPEGISRAV